MFSAEAATAVVLAFSLAFLAYQVQNYLASKGKGKHKSASSLAVFKGNKPFIGHQLQFVKVLPPAL